MNSSITKDHILQASEFSVTRSQGPGGQHVNRTNSAVQIKLDLLKLPLSEDNKVLLFKKLSTRIAQGQYLVLREEGERTQWLNKEKLLEKTLLLLKKALHRNPPRKATKPTKGSKERRLQSKSLHSNLKKSRKSSSNYE